MPEYRKLRIGDMSDNGKITIVDEDRLCYIVKSISNGAVGNRTISKSLLNEYISYLQNNPEEKWNNARNELSGLTDIDKYEYGYNATLVMMAKMVLGYVEVIGSSIGESTTTKIISGNLQQIYYGSPGTGKSHIINKTVCGESVIRTTFHPDSDYSTFVGCYKPTTKNIKMRDMSGNIIIEDGEELTEDRIVYEFVDQAFLQAYTQAWKFYDEKNDELKNQFLVIEEINRGNCAQIFGDLFQLLDRNTNGFSDYPIQADNDMRKQLAKAFKDITISEENKSRINACYKGNKDYVSQVLKGEILLLPDNLYIWATMNTSDQSLFPIDSAFKRRWDWQYMPIAKGCEEGKELKWIIEAETNEYDWWSFLEKINEQIGSITNSEDKKLGFFFCKAKNGKISAETFVGKVIFYLWNDVFKDWGFDGELFKDTDGEMLSFDKFYSTNYEGKVVVNKDKVQKFLDNLKVDAIVDSDEPEDNNAEAGFTRRHIKVVWPDGRIMENNNSTTTLIDVINAIGPARVAELGMKISGYDLLSREKIGHNEGGYGNSQRQINDGYWLVTKFSTDAKLAKLQELSNRLNLDLKVEVIEIENDYENNIDDDNGDNDSNEVLEFRYKYWSDLLKYINATSYKDIFKTENRKSTNRKYYDFYLGTSDCNLYVTYDKDIPTVGYWIKKRALYDKFLSYKTELEHECGNLKWYTIKKACKIIKEISFANKTQEEQFELILNELVKLQTFFIKYMK